MKKYDVLCFNECWVKCPDDFDIEGYEKSMCIEKNVTVVLGIVVFFFRKRLSLYVEIVKCVADCMI